MALSRVCEKEVGLGLWAATFSKQRRSVDLNRKKRRVFSTTGTGSYIPVDFLPMPNVHSIHYYDNLYDFKLKDYNRDFFNELVQLKPPTMANFAWYSAMLAFLNCDYNMHGMSGTKLMNLADSSYFENSVSDFTGISDVSLYQPSIAARTTPYHFHHSSLTHIASSSQTRELVCRKSKNSNAEYHYQYLGLTTYLDVRRYNGSVLLKADGCYIGACLMLKSEHYNDWCKAVYESQALDILGDNKDVKWKSNLTSTTFNISSSQPETFPYSAEIDPDWFVLIVNDEVLDRFQKQDHFPDLSRQIESFIKDCEEDDIEVKKVGIHSLRDFTCAFKVDFSKHVGGKLTNYNAESKKMLIKLSKSIKGKL